MAVRIKTIFITSFFGLIARNILATDFLTLLGTKGNGRVVVLAPVEKKILYTQRFGSSNVVVEGIKMVSPTRRENFFSALFLNMSDTAARRIHRLIELKRDKKYLSFVYHLLLAKILGKFKSLRSFFRWLDFVLGSKNRFEYYFEKYKPDLIFATDVFEPTDIQIMREAKHRGVAAVGMVRSWDNVTSKGLNRIIPDKLIVNTPAIKQEVVFYNDVDPEDIFVVGIPHYDHYVREKRTSRNELFRKLNLDPTKKTVFFAPPSTIYSHNDPIAETVVRALSPLDVQIILRLYIVGSVNLGGIKPIPNKIAIDDPHSGEDFIQADLTSGDSHLADLLYHSDVVLAFASTLAIDAVVFGKPVVFIGFDAEPKPYWRSLRRFYDYDHQRSILRTGGVKLARNVTELVNYVREYLNNPNSDSDGRKRIIQERCWKLDSQSGERLAEAILKYLRNTD